MNYRHQMILMMIIASALLRFVPFIIFNKTSKLPKQLVNLSKNLPLTAMGMLVIYCLKDINISNPLPEIIAISFVVLSYIWKSNNLISIFGGTIIYLLLVNLVF